LFCDLVNVGKMPLRRIWNLLANGSSYYIKDAPTLDLNIYILKYTSISETLVAKGALSTLDRVNRLMDGLPEDLRKRVLKFFTKKSSPLVWADF